MTALSAGEGQGRKTTAMSEVVAPPHPFCRVRSLLQASLAVEALSWNVVRRIVLGVLYSLRGSGRVFESPYEMLQIPCITGVTPRLPWRLRSRCALMAWGARLPRTDVGTETLGLGSLTPTIHSVSLGHETAWTGDGMSGGRHDRVMPRCLRICARERPMLGSVG